MRPMPGVGGAQRGRCRRQRTPTAPAPPLLPTFPDPIDTVKAQLQVQGVRGPAAYSGALDAARKVGRVAAGGGLRRRTRTALPCPPPTRQYIPHPLDVQIYASQGAPGFFRGLSATLAGSAPGSAVYYAGVEAGRAAVAAVAAPPGPTTDAAVGAVAQLVAGAVFTPVDVIKERLQAQAVMGGAYSYAGPRAAVAAAWAAGGVRELLKGYWMTNSAR